MELFWMNFLFIVFTIFFPLLMTTLQHEFLGQGPYLLHLLIYSFATVRVIFTAISRFGLVIMYNV